MRPKLAPMPAPTLEMPDTAARLWTFAVQTYANDGIREIVLALQDDGDCDVPLLLFLLFAATRGQQISAGEVFLIDAAIAPWRREVVMPLRAVRRALPRDAGDVASLRDLVMKTELEAERGLLSRLATYLGSPIDISGPLVLQYARNNVRAYAGMRPALDEAAVASLLRALPQSA